VGQRHRGGDDEAGCGGGREGNELGFVPSAPPPGLYTAAAGRWAVSRPRWAATASCSGVGCCWVGTLGWAKL
jgi:hypothetical protein